MGGGARAPAIGIVPAGMTTAAAVISPALTMPAAVAAALAFLGTRPGGALPFGIIGAFGSLLANWRADLPLCIACNRVAACCLPSI